MDDGTKVNNGMKGRITNSIGSGVSADRTSVSDRPGHSGRSGKDGKRNTKMTGKVSRTQVGRAAIMVPEAGRPDQDVDGDRPVCAGIVVSEGISQDTVER